MMDIKVRGAKLEFDKKAVRAALRGAGALVAKEARRLVKPSKGSGSVSAPGDVPVSQTGTLARRIKVRPGKGRRQLRVIVRGEAWYALPLETGAKGPGRRRLEPRPLLTTALNNRRSEIHRRVTAAINQGIKFKETS